MKKFFSKYKEIIIAVIIILIIACSQVTKLISNKNVESVKSNKENNNTTNNNEEIISYEDNIELEKEYSMQTGERFAKVGDTIVFSTFFDNCIYKYDLKNKTLTNLCELEDGVLHIYFDGEYVYCMPYYYRGKGIYKIDLSGNVEKIYNGASLQLWLTDNEIYFVDQIGFDDINQIPQGNICKMDKNGNNKEVIIENTRNNFTLYKNKFYYIDNNSKGVYCANIDGTGKKELAKGRNSITTVTDDYVCFFDFADNQKQKVVYLDNNEVVVPGMFGSAKSYDNKTYIYTQKLINEDNIENVYTMYKLENKNVEEVFKSDDVLPYLAYVYENYAYIRDGNDLYRVNLENNSREKLNSYYSFFIGDKAYQVTESDMSNSGILIYDLKENKEEKINL